MLIFYPNPILRQKAKEIKDAKSPEIQELIFEMLKTMEEHEGIGLAAPQVGKSLRLCIVKKDGQTYVLINPKIKSKSWSKEIAEEGCLSFPGKFIPVKRSRKVKVKALDKESNEITLKAEGILARAFQHEIDHLNGILFIDYEAKK